MGVVGGKSARPTTTELFTDPGNKGTSDLEAQRPVHSGQGGNVDPRLKTKQRGNTTRAANYIHLTRSLNTFAGPSVCNGTAGQGLYASPEALEAECFTAQYDWQAD